MDTRTKGSQLRATDFADGNFHKDAVGILGFESHLQTVRDDFEQRLY